MARIQDAPNGENLSPARTEKIAITGSKFVQIANLLKNYVATPAQGQILYYDGTNWVALSPGTSGQFLKTLGAAANPAWDRTPYVLQCDAGVAAGFSPADATTYYFGSIPTRDPGTTAAVRRMYIQHPGTVKAISVFANFTAGSGEASTLSFRLNNTTDTTITSAVDMSAAPFVANVTGLNIAVVAGDYFEIKWVTPTWATNPTGVVFSVKVFIQ
jgi:hypothetical protein